MRVLSYVKLFFLFAKIGVMTFGGGYAMLPILQRELVEARHWVTEEELTDYFAIGQCTPGIIAVNTATFVGHKRKGIPGGIVATLGVVFPSLIIIIILAGLITTFADLPIVQNDLQCSGQTLEGRCKIPAGAGDLFGRGFGGLFPEYFPRCVCADCSGFRRSPGGVACYAW